DHLIPAKGVLPDGGRNVAPEGFAVEVDIVGGVAQQRGCVGWCERPCDGLALAGHGDAALAAMSPPGDEIEIARVGVESAGNGGEHADDAKFRTDWREVHAWHALFDIEQRGDLTPE